MPCGEGQNKSVKAPVHEFNSIYIGSTRCRHCSRQRQGLFFHGAHILEVSKLMNKLGNY